MADIDKPLPNVNTEIKVPGEEEIQVAQEETINEQVGSEDIEVTAEEDGVATFSMAGTSRKSLATSSNEISFVRD